MTICQVFLSDFDLNFPPKDTAVEDSGNKILIRCYQAVRDGRISDPEALRQLAHKFQAVADDPIASKGFPYDAQRAAQSLLQLAKQYENQARMIFNDEKPSSSQWSRANLNDDLLAGG